jgi:hypothetical protein
MTDGIYLSVAATAAILAAVLVLAVLSSSVLGMDGLPERRAVALFWGCLAGTWLLAIVAAVAIRSIW